MYVSAVRGEVRREVWYVHIYISKYTWIYKQEHMNICQCTYAHLDLYSGVRIEVWYVCTCTNIYMINIHIYIYIHICRCGAGGIAEVRREAMYVHIYIITYMWIYKQVYMNISQCTYLHLFVYSGFFCKRALHNRLYSAKQTYDEYMSVHVSTLFFIFFHILESALRSGMYVYV